MKVKVLVVPVLRRYWLFHAWKEVPAHERVTKNWKDAPSLKEKASILLSSLQTKASQKAEEQWHKFEAAPEGSLNNRFFRLAQWALSRVDPSETFLKALPQQADSLDIMYPASLPERLVRRRLRHLAAKAEPFHNSRLRVWSAAVVPQLPLIPLPLPNITIYYTVWRIISNRSASRGAHDLSSALRLHSDQQRLKLAQQLRELQQQGVVLKRGSWAEQLAADAPRLQHQLQQALESLQKANSSSSSSSNSNYQQQQVVKRLPLPQFISDKQLDQLVSPTDRLVSPLPEAAVTQLVEVYQQHHLLEHYRAANRKCLGDKAQQQTQQQPKQRDTASSNAPSSSMAPESQQGSPLQQQTSKHTAASSIGSQSSPASMAASAKHESL